MVIKYEIMFLFDSYGSGIMKKITRLSVLLICIISVYTILLAGGVEENNNHSAEFMKTLNRNASTESDATFYNPAGTALMNQGFYIYLSAQSIYIPIEIHGASLTRTVYRGEKTSYCTPNLHLVYKKDNVGGGAGDLAWSFAVMAIGGGGFGVYNRGLSYIDNTLFLIRNNLNALYTQLGIPYTLGTFMTSKFKGTSAYYSFMTNVAYSFAGDRVALSLGYRFIYGDATYDAKLKSDGLVIPLGGSYHARQSGTAHGIIAGISARPVDSLTIGFKFEYNSPLKMKTKADGDFIVGLVDSSFRNGGAAHRQLPMNANIGLTYRFSGIQLAWSYSYFLNRLALWNGRERSHTDGYEVGMGIDYTFSDVPLNIGCGWAYSYGGARPSGQSQLAEMPNGHTFGAGVSYLFDRKVKITCSLGYIYFLPVSINKGTMLRFLPATLYKKGIDVALGVEWKVI